MDKEEILRTAQINKIKEDMQNKKAAYFSAHTGWGKTTLMKQYFDYTGQEYEYLSCTDKDFGRKLNSALNGKNKNIVIDDIQNGEEVYCLITDALNKCGSDTKFYMLGRRVLPQFLKPYYITGMMISYEYDFYALNADEIEELFEKMGKSVSRDIADWLAVNTGGWLLGIRVFVKNYEQGADIEKVFNRTRHDIYKIFDERLWARFSDDMRKFMIQIGHLSEFTIEEAQMLSGQSDVNDVLKKILGIGNFIKWSPSGKYEIMELFSYYLSWKQRTECPKSFLVRQYESTALYFALNNDITNALYYYKLAENREKVAELLLKNAEKHAGNGSFYKLREYYFSVPDSIVYTSPELMSALSMLYSILCDPDKSEEYYSKLVDYLKQAETKEQKKNARDKIAYLDIALPHRGIKGLADVFRKYAPAAMCGKLNVQSMSVSGNMPGIINGGKDFCKWTKNDRLLYKMLKQSVNFVLGKDCRGIMEIALGESLFEKNTDSNYTEELTLLNSGYYEAEATGNMQLQFAALGVMARIYVAAGKLNYAYNAIDKLKGRILPNEELYGNVEAFLVNLSMLDGGGNEAAEWFDNAAPDEKGDFYIIDRYRYFTKIRIYIVKQMYKEALSLLNKADEYFVRYQRTICHMEAAVLRAVIYYRMKNIAWKTELKTVLSLCEEYGYIRIIAQYGIAVLDMLKMIEEDDPNKYLEIVILNTKKIAVLYPLFLETEKNMDYNFSKKELAILRLMCSGHTNSEIASIIGSSVRTVKYYLSTIYEKLGVKGRAGAVNMCLKHGVV